MDFGWSQDQQDLRDSMEAFARGELSAEIVERDRAAEFSKETWSKCAQVGIQGLPISEEYGGQGADALTTVLAMEALGKGSPDNGLIFSLNAHIWSAAMPILRFGTEAQKKQFLPGMCSGDLIGVQAMTEPGSGSDAFALSTSAVQEGEGFRLQGSKTFITNAPMCDLFVVFARTNPKLGPLGLSAFIVERDTEGVVVGPNMDKMGLRTSPMSEVFFDGCLIPAENLLGKIGNGMAIFNHSIDWERACILASAIGTMERQIAESVQYAKERKQFGVPIGDFQGVSHTIANMEVRLEAARLLVYKAAWAKMEKSGGVSSRESSIAKLAISEAWVQTCLDAMQIHGASGYMRGTGHERNLRDALAGRIYSGTSDIQRNIIAKAMGL